MNNAKLIRLSKESVNRVNLEHLVEYVEWSPEHAKYFLAAAGQEIYKLLTAISLQLDPCEVTDVGTHVGCSALALSANENVKVLTCDIVNHIMKTDGTKTIAFRPNITRKILSGQAIVSKIAQGMLVMIDIDPHNGVEELKFIHKLQQQGFKGLLVLDNIHIGPAMKACWDNVPANLKKIDVTSIGHWAGAGIIVFDPTTIDVVVVE
jgi:predicted O-methyltransferase YrrM